MSYWTAAQLQPGREALAVHLLAQENFTIYALKLRVRRTVCGRLSAAEIDVSLRLVASEGVGGYHGGWW